ncbi:MAG TPA: putative oxidoreductase C-terminal domain-containing protein [Burkholderiales bacterium]|nr:putative oxidoreductase C-terminal domain-containing protein [Burkholderiales bacterium]
MAEKRSGQGPGIDRRSILKATLAAALAARLPNAAGADTSSTSHSQEKSVAAAKHTIVVLNPGHFHAGLTLRKSHPRLNEDVYIYTEDGPDVESFLRMVQSFNDRPKDPTRWKLHVYRGADYLERLRAERPGDVVIIAGRNDTKMTSIHRVHADGLFVLGDKPWLIAASELGMLNETALTPPLAMDIMTERHEAATLVQKALTEHAEVFGRFRTGGDEPAIAMKSVHHLYKIVNQKPLVRPAWFFDTSAQGEGITDVTTHLVDLVQWMTGGGQPFDYERDIELLSARQWPTQVPRDIFARITGLPDFPATLRDHVKDGALHYLCNAGFSYRVRGIPVYLESLWNLAIPEGGGDTHDAIVRGTKADLVIEQGPATRFATELTVRPAENSSAYSRSLSNTVASLQSAFPGIAVEPTGPAYRITIPAALGTTHEEHFAAVLEEFLRHIESGEQPANLGPDLIAKYTLLARAAELSHRSA